MRILNQLFSIAINAVISSMRVFGSTKYTFVAVMQHIYWFIENESAFLKEPTCVI